jgi:Zn-dependent protease/predicted transcriptional regulator
MTESLRLGRIAGVAVGINWSVLVIFGLIVLGLALGRFPAEYPDQPAAAHVAAGLIAAVLFFLSLLAHEIAHAVVAMRNGIGVEGITLWLFGGVAKLEGEPETPGADLRIAGVGPLVSVLLAIAFGGLAFGAVAVGVPGLVFAVLLWLAIINGVLAVFNLVPAAPLDGGRVLRALLWYRRGDRYSAAISAARAGRVFGFVLIGLGLLEFAAGAGLGGLWLVLIGWFLTGAAKAEEQHAEVRGALGDVRVRDVMTEDPTVAPPDLSVDEFVEAYVWPHRHSTFPLVEGGRIAGLISLRRLKELPASERRDRRVRELACPPEEIGVADPDELVAEVVARMNTCADGRLLVVADGELIGILSPTDVARVLEVGPLRARRERDLH